MEAGLFYTDVGPFLVAILLVAFFHACLRDRVAGAAWLTGLVLIAPFFTYRDILQAAGVGTAIVLFALAAFLTSRPRLRLSSNTVDRAMLLYAIVMGVAALRGLMAGHARAYWAGDVYHYLVLGPVLYGITRVAIRPGHVARLIPRIVWIATGVGAITILVLLVSRSRPDWMWLVGGPLDEGGIRLKPDFGFPLVALALAMGRLQAGRLPRGWLAVLVLLTVLVLTYKRTFWVASFAAFFLLVAIGARAQGLRAVFRAWLPLAPVLGAAILGAALLGANLESLTARTGDIATPAAAPTMQTRLAEWRAVLTDIRQSPMGHGLGAERVLDGGRRAHYVHSIYLQWSVQAGLVGLLAGVGLFAVAIGLGVRHSHATHDLPGITAATFGLAVAGLVLLSVYTPLTGLVLGLNATLLDPSSP